MDISGQGWRVLSGSCLDRLPELEGFEFIGCELTDEYLPIISGRLSHANEEVSKQKREEENNETEKLF